MGTRMLTAGASGLVGTFNACVDCFDRVHIGRQLGQDYETATIKLDVVRLRLTRWGTAIGIGSRNEETAVAQLKHHLPKPDRDLNTIMRTLNDMLNLFERSAEASGRLTLQHPTSESQGTDGLASETAILRNLHAKMRELAVKRQKQPATSQRMGWALHRTRDFEILLENLTGLVSALVALAPLQSQQELCDREVAEIGSDEGLMVLDELLRDSAGDETSQIDELLCQRVSKAIGQRKGTVAAFTWTRSNAGKGSNIHQGDNVWSKYRGQIREQGDNYMVEDSQFAEEVKFHQGHNYGKSRKPS